MIGPGLLEQKGGNGTRCSGGKKDERLVEDACVILPAGFASRRASDFMVMAKFDERKRKSCFVLCPHYGSERTDRSREYSVTCGS